MFTNKTNLIVFIVVVVVAALVFSSVLSFISIKEAKKENEAAQSKILELNNSIDELEGVIKNTNESINKHEEKIKSYQEIFTAWANATPKVKGAIDKIMEHYSVCLESSHLFTKEKFEQLEGEMMSSVYAAIRSTDPDSVARAYEKLVAEAQKTRFDVVLQGKIDKINAGGVTYPEDEAGILDARKYYDTFLKDEAVIKSFDDLGLTKTLKELEASLDGDEEKDLAAAFEKAVASIKTPITLKTSLSGANSAWGALCAALEKGDELPKTTKDARTLLDTYTARIDQLTLAKDKANGINSKITSLKVVADLETKSKIESLETEIAAWVKEFNIDSANMSLVNDLSPTKKAYENALNELRLLYETFKKAALDIGKVTLDSKPKIDSALKAHGAIKNFKDTDALLSLKSPYKVAELYATVEKALADYNYFVSLVESIRNEIDRLYSADPNVTRDEIKALNEKVNELVSLGEKLTSLNTKTFDYVARLDEVRLLPDKNEAFGKIKVAYDDYYSKAQGDRDIIIALVQVKDETLNKIENARSVDEIKALITSSKAQFEKCFE